MESKFLKDFDTILNEILVITEPGANVAVTEYQKITAGTIDVTEL